MSEGPLPFGGRTSNEEHEMPPRLRVVGAVALAGAAVVVAGLVLVSRHGASERESMLAAVRSGERPLNVILISFDTTRADRLGCYGYEHAETPAIDRFAGGGVRFARAKTHVPITLPSHSTLFTGTTPVVHGAHHHSSVLADEGNTTLAEILRSNGYRTAAFIGATVLDHSFGIGQGFEHYADDLGFKGSVGAARVEREAREVFAEARDWLDENADEPFFAFVHLYDPHLPYRPPSPYALRHHGRPYDGEIAYLDSEFGRFIEYLERSALRENTLVVVFGDHGESLGEHGIEGHSAFIYETMTWVPLLMSCPGLVPPGEVIDAQVRLIDVLPTVLDILGIEPPARAEGVTLLPYVLGRERTPELPAYIESHHLNDLFGWSPLLGVETERWKYIRAPRPELYDLATDPGELENVHADHPGVVADLDGLLVGFLTGTGDATEPSEPGELDATMIERLASLGYFGRTSASEERPDAAGGDFIDPKDVWDTYLLYQKAFVASSYSESEELRAALAALYERLPDNGTVRLLLAKSYMAGGEPARAMPILERDLETSPDDLFLNLSLGIVYGQLGRYEEAERCLAAVLEVQPGAPKALSTLGSIYLSRGEYDRAEEVFEDVVGRDDADIESRHVSLVNLGMIHYLVRGTPTEAVPYFKEALSMHPRSTDAHYYLAHIFAKEPETHSEALRHGRAFLSQSPAADDRRARIEYIVEGLGRS
jgi:arylsulfatase A-like enzyme/tetratricopeptide (TPR) repeat protein